MAQLALERGVSAELEPPEKDVWAEHKSAGFVEVGDRKVDGVDYRLLWKQAGGLMLLGALAENGEHVVTLVSEADAYDSLHHPTNYFSNEATDRLYPRAA